MADQIYSLPRVETFGDRTVDAHRYTDPKNLDIEIERVFKRSWVVAVPLWRVAEPNRFATMHEAGFDVIVTRDAGGTLRAFRNSCLHRGSRLGHGCGTAMSLQCKYHGWKYGLDGHLSSVPGSTGFGTIDVSKMHLSPLPMKVSAGMVWVNLSDDPPPFEEHLEGIASELAPYQLDQMVPVEERVFTIPVNWKSMIENAFDYYHVAQVHRHTIHAHVDSQPEMALYGDHIRQDLHIAPYGWRRRLDERCSRGGPYADRQMSRLFKYTIFPNTMLNVLPYHLTVMRFWPDGVGRTRLHYSFCKRRGATGVEWLRAHGTWLASRVILAEDVRMLVRCQGALDAQAVPHHLLHDYEAASAHFHAVLGRRMNIKNDGPVGQSNLL
jgi:phenylpropionate dioxygenase-like ring-hydroxylating dioxygenase large terminal subunit